jgi:epoxyqueuosine reductase
MMNDEMRRFLANFCSTNDLNRLPAEFGGDPYYDDPWIGVARGDDPIFVKFKEVVAPQHLTPAEMWLANGFPDAPGLASRLRVLSIVFPYVDRIRQEGAKAKDGLPPEIYCVARNFADAFIEATLKGTAAYLQGRGWSATPGVGSEAYGVTLVREPFRTFANWSERHIAFAAGLGTFSLHEGLITEAGCNVRLGSVITDAPLVVTPRPGDDPYSYCLHYAKDTCRACVARCPAEAISDKGHDKVRCLVYGRKVGEEMRKRPFAKVFRTERRRLNGEHRDTVNVGCGLCQFGVPCMARRPA